MQDRITGLLGKLVRAEGHHELSTVAAELQRAIRHRIDSMRQDVVGIALFDRIVDLDANASQAAIGSKT